MTPTERLLKAAQAVESSMGTGKNYVTVDVNWLRKLLDAIKEAEVAVGTADTAYGWAAVFLAYGEHTDDCALTDDSNNDSMCTCGFSTLIDRAVAITSKPIVPSPPGLAGIGREEMIALLEKRLLADTRIIGVNATVIGDIAADLTDAILVRIGGAK